MSDIGTIALVKFEYTDGSGWKVRPGLITGEYLNDYQVMFITKEVDKYGHEDTSIMIDNEDLATGKLKKRSIVRTHKTFWVEKTQCKKIGTLKTEVTDKILRLNEKYFTMGEGGAVCTNDAKLKRFVESFRDWGRDCWCAPGKDNTCGKRFSQQLGDLPYGYDHKYVYSHFGYNLKVTDMQAAIGCAQLEKLPAFIEARKKNFRLLYEGLKDLEDRFILPEATHNSDPSWFGFLLTVRKDAGFTRDEIVKHLEAHNIQTRMLFAGNIIRHPCFDALRSTGQGYRIVSPNSTLQPFNLTGH